MSEQHFSLAGAELDWPISAAAGMTNHPNLEASLNRYTNLVDAGMTIVPWGSLTLGEARGGNGFVKSESGLWEHQGGDEHVDLATGAGYNSKGLPNVGTDLGMENLDAIVDIANARGAEAALSLSPVHGNPVEELAELVAIGEKALQKGVLYVEINLSCPNVPGKPAFYLDVQALADFFESLKQGPILQNKHGYPGIYVKYGPIAPDQLQPQVHFMDVPTIGGYVTSNTLGNQEPKDENGNPAIKYNDGKAGMSGPALKDLGREQLYSATMETDKEIISVLGVDSGEEVVHRLRRDAAAVQIGSIIYWPELIDMEDTGEVVEFVKKGIVDELAA